MSALLRQIDSPGSPSIGLPSSIASTAGVAVLVAVMVGCANDAAAGQATRTKPWRSLGQVTIQLGDCSSIPPTGSCQIFYGQSIEIVRGVKSDTIGPISTVLGPWVLMDSTLVLPWLVEADGSLQVELRVYHRDSGEITAVSMPNDYDPAFTGGHLFPPRGLMAYRVALPEEDGSRIVVRTWGDWRLVTEGPLVKGCTDTGLEYHWSVNGQYIVWYPPPCEDGIPERDSVYVKSPKR